MSIGLDFDTIYNEIESQYYKSSDQEQKQEQEQEQTKQKIWITYVEEGIARLDDEGLTIPIGDKISLLAFEHNEQISRRFDKV